MTITVPKSGFITLEKFKEMVDISKIVYYSLDEEDGNLKLRFYDKNKRLIKPKKESKNGKEKSSKQSKTHK
jgi:hypothetical protein